MIRPKKPAPVHLSKQPVTNTYPLTLADGSVYEVNLDELSEARRLREVIGELERAGCRDLGRLVEACTKLRDELTHLTCPLLQRVHNMDERITVAFNAKHGSEHPVPIPEDVAQRELIDLGKVYEHEEHVHETERREHAVRVYNLTVVEAAELKSHVRKAYGHLGAITKVMRLEEQSDGED